MIEQIIESISPIGPEDYIMFAFVILVFIFVVIPMGIAALIEFVGGIGQDATSVDLAPGSNPENYWPPLP